ncbi:MAG: hypothetical protein HY460_02355 [Parcubacteria group bacterium]|nr:hypothetical protein [Parcubacteria group bacterium]
MSELEEEHQQEVAKVTIGQIRMVENMPRLDEVIDFLTKQTTSAAVAILSQAHELPAGIILWFFHDAVIEAERTGSDDPKISKYREITERTEKLGITSAPRCEAIHSLFTRFIHVTDDELDLLTDRLIAAGRVMLASAISIGRSGERNESLGRELQQVIGKLAKKYVLIFRRAQKAKLS